MMAPGLAARALLVLWILLLHGVAAADSRGASAAAPHVARARQLFADKQYIEAADELQRAYAFEAKPIYLFNAGTAYRKSEKRKEALDMFKQFLEIAPAGPLADEARTNIRDLEAVMTAQDRWQEVNQVLAQERHKPVYRRPWFIALASCVGLGIFIGIVVGGARQGKANEANTFVRAQFQF